MSGMTLWANPQFSQPHTMAVAEMLFLINSSAQILVQIHFFESWSQLLVVLMKTDWCSFQLPEVRKVLFHILYVCKIAHMNTQVYNLPVDYV